MTFARVTQQAQQRERRLLWIACAFLLINAFTLALVSEYTWSAVGLFVIWSGAAVTGHSTLNRILPRRDPFFFPITMLLGGWGLLLIQRLAPAFAWRQAIWLYVGIGAMLLICTLPGHMRWLRRFRYSWLFGGLVLLLVTIILGVNPSGSGPRLWLGVAGVYFQPSELLKLVLVIFLASYMADYRDIIRSSAPGQNVPPLRTLGPLVLMWGLCMVVVIWQQDLGTASIFFVVFLTLLYIASGQMRYAIAGVSLLTLAAAAAYRLFDVVKLRIDIWLDPWPEASSRAFQIVQSLLAFSAGGILGKGIGMGAPVYVPVVHSDFIFAAVAEEWGLVGILCVMLCLFVLIMRGLQIASLWIDGQFRMLLAAGLSILLAAQSVMIMGGVLKLIPLTGVTLPFMSYGGSSLLINFALVGLFLVLSSPPAGTESDVQ